MKISAANFFPDSACKSLNGIHFIKCEKANSSAVCAPKIRVNSGLDCRSCQDPAEWRCDSGHCIPLEKVQDGLKDCADGSDEISDPIKWYIMIAMTAGIAALGIILSFIHRYDLQIYRLFQN